MVVEDLLIIIAGIVAGPIVVEVLGYAWHRAAEHKGIFGNKVRHRHWVHHEVHYPLESLRGPIPYHDAGGFTMYAAGVALSVLALVFLPWLIVMPALIAAWIYAIMIGEYFHRAFHIREHWLQRFAWFRRLRLLHDIHHMGPYNYGIVLFWMDGLCGTLRDHPPGTPEERFPGFVKPS